MDAIKILVYPTGTDLAVPANMTKYIWSARLGKLNNEETVFNVYDKSNLEAGKVYTVCYLVNGSMKCGNFQFMQSSPEGFSTQFVAVA